MMHSGEYLAMTIPSGLFTLGTLAAWIRVRPRTGPAWSRPTAVSRSLLPLAMVTSTCAGLSFSSFAQYEAYLDHLPATAANVTVHTQRDDLVPLSELPTLDANDDHPTLETTVIEGKKVDPATTYLAAGRRVDYYRYVSNSNQGGVINDTLKKNVDVLQFGIIGKKSGNALVMETSGDTIKVVRDLDPEGSTKPYYESTSCTWKNSDVQRACPLDSRELHLYSGSVDYPEVVTDNPWNTNDDVTDPLVAKQANVADNSAVTAEQIQAGQTYQNPSN